MIATWQPLEANTRYTIVCQVLLKTVAVTILPEEHLSRAVQYPTTRVFLTPTVNL